MEALLLRLDAPLVAFGGPAVDENRTTMAFPGRSLLTGLLGNALGYDHRDHEALSRLQRRLRHAVREDHPGVPLVDYQTVDLSQPFLQGGWTTRGAPESRGGASAEGTHIKYAHYLADAVFTVALTLTPTDEAPTLDALEAALRSPERPLFIGRKCCLPSSTMALGRVTAGSLAEALQRAPLSSRAPQDERSFLAWWPADEASELPSELITVTDERDWDNQIHGGRRWMRRGKLTLQGGAP
ncbi:MAG: type I-E CRISPR-associated protein Cas5/CasD [Deltaproteobacteria bacterium]|nr:type I-E CRISPR-associated protein Cas5/CasD [Deltaproteobacteria bacterium]